MLLTTVEFSGAPIRITIKLTDQKNAINCIIAEPQIN